MIVPDYWAEARKQHRDGKKQITVRRFGWSNDSESDALGMAETRASDALARILSGEKLDRAECKTAYNGAFGVPIREEVLLRRGEEVITRNAYGARCLNTPRALFADIDFSHEATGFSISVVLALLVAVSVGVSLYFGRWSIFFGMLLLSLILASSLASFLIRLGILLRGGAERVARRRISGFLKQHPAWNLRVYNTPNGLRLLATHQPFDAVAPEVQAFFAAVGADPVYRRMCANQRCFRARLTAKPWRIGISAHMRPRPGVWPVSPDRLHLRTQWVDHYERLAADFAACRYTESLGSGVVHEDIREVIELHDDESRANQHRLAIA